jgi:hypothetical protein
VAEVVVSLFGFVVCLFLSAVLLSVALNLQEFVASSELQAGAPVRVKATAAVRVKGPRIEDHKTTKLSIHEFIELSIFECTLWIEDLVV